MKREPDELDALVAGVLEAIAPATAYALAARLRERGDSMPEVQVYRVLRRLGARGLVRQIWLGRRYVPAAPGDPPTAALVCRGCGRVELAPAAAESAGLRARAASLGFRADETIVEVIGLCRDCGTASGER